MSLQLASAHHNGHEVHCLSQILCCSLGKSGPAYGPFHYQGQLKPL